MQESASRAWWSMWGPLRSCAPPWLRISSVVETPMRWGQLRFLGTSRGVGVGVGGDAVLVVEVEAADIA